MDNEFKSRVDGILKDCLSQLEGEKSFLISELQKVESSIESLKKDPNKSLNFLNQMPAKVISYNSDDLKNATGPDLFMWGLNRIGKEATVDQVYSEVSKLNLKTIQERVTNNTLRQLLLVSANTLCKKNILIKDERKRGAIFRKVK